MKSVLIHVEIDEALNAHHYQANARHRLERGDRRLTVRNGRSWDHDGVPCAAVIVQPDLAALQAQPRHVQTGSRHASNPPTRFPFV